MDFGASLASSRLRAAIPQRELKKLGVEQGKDVLIYGKHWLPEKVKGSFGKLVYDVCDDHFRTPNLRAYYLRNTIEADLVTCNSLVMQERIREETGRDSIVIREPYESAEYMPTIGPSLLWYGHNSNLSDLVRIKPYLRHPLLVLSNDENCIEWTPETFKTAIQKPCIVVIPTGKSLAKSENRMVEAIRTGKYVCAEHLPSYEPFNEFFPLGDIPEHIEWALSHVEDSLDRIRKAQSYIREKYSPRSIGEQWLKVLNEHFNLQRFTNSGSELDEAV